MDDNDNVYIRKWIVNRGIYLERTYSDMVTR